MQVSPKAKIRRPLGLHRRSGSRGWFPKRSPEKGVPEESQGKNNPRKSPAKEAKGHNKKRP